MRRLAHCSRACRHRRIADASDLALRLRRQHAHEVGVGHGRERMVLHAGFGQQLVADEQVAVADRAPVLREGRAGNREVRVQRIHQRIGHRTDIAARRGVEGRAVLEIDLPASCRLQPRQRSQRLLDRLAAPGWCAT